MQLKAIGTGPYIFQEWAKGQHIKLTANPDWWGNGSADAQGAASIKDVTFQFRAEREVRAAMTRTGEADIARWITGDQCRTTPNCQATPSLETIFVRMDIVNPTLKDKRVREAIALSIDKDAIINELMGGGDVARQLVGPSATGYNANLQPYPYDLAEAKQLIAEAKAAGVPVDAPLTMFVRRAYIVGLEDAAEAIAAGHGRDRPDRDEDPGRRDGRARRALGCQHRQRRRSDPGHARHARARQRADGLLVDGHLVLHLPGAQLDRLRPDARSDAREGAAAHRRRSPEGVRGDREVHPRPVLHGADWPPELSTTA